jgi:NADH-quinone oxidoreductase subunit G
MERAPKPVASCATSVFEGMVVKTNSDTVKKARSGVMEFLLANHPLDCPICDQGGECDLQDQAVGYGSGVSRFLENKRAVADKDMGPIIKTVMTRCIHCTRCIRFSEEVAGTPVMGALSRGENMEISTLEKTITSEMSGNLVDLCPVGALTSKPYAFKARSWELKKTESIDVLDAVGTNIRVDSYDNEVMRILPRLNESINEEWLADKSRYAFDGLKYQRLDTPYIRNQQGKLEAVSWQEALQKVTDIIKGSDTNKIAALSGDTVNQETLFVAKDLFDNIGITAYDCRSDNAFIGADSHDQQHIPRENYLFNTGIAGLDEADFLLIIGSNPRVEAPIINSRILKNVNNNNLKVAVLADIDRDEVSDLHYDYQYLGDDLNALDTADLSALKAANKPAIIVGEQILTRDDAPAIMAKIASLVKKHNVVNEGWNGFNILHTAASRVGGLDIGFTPTNPNITNSRDIKVAYRRGVLDALFLIATDEEVQLEPSGDVPVIYIGYHGNSGAGELADIILPMAAYTECTGTYVNTQGVSQKAIAAIKPVGEAKEGWKIFKALANKLGLEKSLPYNNMAELWQKMAVSETSNANAYDHNFYKQYRGDEVNTTQPLRALKVNYYQTCSISKNSPVMAKCSQAVVKAKADLKQQQKKVA